MTKGKDAPKREAKKPRKAPSDKKGLGRDRGGAMSTDSQRRYTRA